MSTNTGILVFVLLLVVIGGGIAFYFYSQKETKPEKESSFDKWMKTATEEDIKQTMDSL